MNVKENDENSTLKSGSTIMNGHNSTQSANSNSSAFFVDQSHEMIMSKLARNPVVQSLGGHPKTIATFAPLLEQKLLSQLEEESKICYANITGYSSHQRKDIEEIDDENIEDVINSASISSLWNEIVQGKTQTQSTVLGLPWYTLGSALSRQFITRIEKMNKLQLATANLRSLGSRGGSVSKEKYYEPGNENIRCLSDIDIDFLMNKLATNKELVTQQDFARFCSIWVPILTLGVMVSKEWMCMDPILIEGLLERKAVDSRLSGKDVGTFLVRFSTSRPGRLSISFVTEDNDNKGYFENSEGNQDDSLNGRKIKHCLLEPTIHGFILYKVDKEVCYPTLKSCILDCSVLKQLPGGQSKEEAFAQLHS